MVACSVAVQWCNGRVLAKAVGFWSFFVDVVCEPGRWRLVRRCCGSGLHRTLGASWGAQGPAKLSKQDLDWSLPARIQQLVRRCCREQRRKCCELWCFFQNAGAFGVLIQGLRQLV